MISEFIYDINIEINQDASSLTLDELKHNIELLACNPTLVTIFYDLGEITPDGNISFVLEEKLDSEEDYSDEVETILEYLLETFPDQIEEGSKFQYINRNAILSVSWIMEEGEWIVYQDIDREYGFGEFEDDSEEW